MATTGTAAAEEASATRLSYKFQRLREKLRNAVANGELSGKLPGERTLAKRFNVNAKTLSKALTDLAAEGLLDRSIGRGTFVKGSAPEPARAGRWLILCDPGTRNSAVVQALLKVNPEAEVAEDLGSMRPSFINQFSDIIDLASHTPEAFLRGLVVRNIPVVTVGREPKLYSMNTVVMDRQLGLRKIVRDLLLAGHRRFAAAEGRGVTIVSEAIRQGATQYAQDATVDTFLASEVGAVLEGGITAVICDSVPTAAAVMDVLSKLGVAVPERLSLAAVGCCFGECPCTGYYATASQAAEAIIELLRDTQPKHPVTLWLAGTKIDQGTIGPTNGAVREAAMPLQITAAVAV